MTYEEAIKTLKIHQEWRLGADIEMLEPKIITEAIDAILFYHPKQVTDTILRSVLNNYCLRSEFGQKKYNTTLDRKDLSILDWINHAQEEAMDLTLYLEKIKKMLTTQGININ